MAAEFTSQLVSALVSNFFARFVTFLLSTWITRKLLPSQMGVSFSYEVYLDAIVFMGREAIRCVAVRYTIIQETHSDSVSSKKVFAINLNHLVAMLNTSALIIPTCALVMIIVELLGGIVLPLGNALVLWLQSCWELRNTGIIFAPFPAAPLEELGWIAIFPSLSQRLWPSWAVAWEYVREVHLFSNPGFNQNPMASLFSSAVLMTSFFQICIRLLLPEILVWSGVLALAFSEPAVALCTALNLFRTTVLADAFAVSGRQITTILALRFWIPLGASSSSTAPDGLARCVAASSPLHCEDVFRQMQAVNEAWRVRLVFGLALFMYGVSLTLFYGVAFGKRWRRLRWCLGADRWEPPSVPAGGLTSLLSSSSSEVFFSVSQAAEGGERNLNGVQDKSPGKDKRKECGAIVMKPLVRYIFAVPVAISEHVTPLLFWYFDWSLALNALHYHRRVLQAFFKESLTRVAISEGSNFALVSLADAASRGCYQIISRLGLLVVRSIFRIWDHACLGQWSRLAQQGEARRKEALNGLSLMLRISFYVGFFCSLAGPLYAGLVLRTLYGGRWSTPSSITSLQYFCHTLGVIAWNGLTDNFLRAVATPQLLKKQQIWSLIISIIYVLSSYVFLWDAEHPTPGKEGSTHDEPQLENQQSTCDGTTVVNIILLLQQVRMIVHIVANFALITFFSDILPSRLPATRAKKIQVSLWRKNNTGTTSEGRKDGDTIEPSFELSSLVAFWSDIFVPFLSPSFIPLAGMYVWTRTPALFPTSWTNKLYMPPLLGVIYALVIFATDSTVRCFTLKVVKGFLKKS